MSIQSKVIKRTSIQRQERQQMCRPRGILKLLAVLLTLVLVAAACGDDDAGDTGDDAGDTGDDAGDAMEGVLADVCPNPVIVQTDWHAQAEHGPTYELLG